MGAPGGFIVFNVNSRYLTTMNNARNQRRDQPPGNLQELGNQFQGQACDCSMALKFKTVVSDGEDHVAVLFYSPIVTQHIVDSSIAHMDGSFRVVPEEPHCSHLLTVMATYKNECFPMFFVLMASKTKAAYVHVFQYLKQQYPSLSPAVIVAEFEGHLHRVLKTVFPRTTVTGSWYSYANLTVVDQAWRTSIELEAYHKALKARFRRRPNVWMFTEVLRRTENVYAQRYLAVANMTFEQVLKRTENVYAQRYLAVANMTFEQVLRKTENVDAQRYLAVARGDARPRRYSRVADNPRVTRANASLQYRHILEGAYLVRAKEAITRQLKSVFNVFEGDELDGEVGPLDNATLTNPHQYVRARPLRGCRQHDAELAGGAPPSPLFLSASVDHPIKFQA
ncbi:hypothetical protein J6590_080276 [Homalodisca vitripennis]|nr:hypothetical protein J6590_080276 [Homalodisca vitripennis]